jgi:predicted PurR-regulated permease PerM
MNFDFNNSVHKKIFINSLSLIIAIVFYLILSKLNVILSFVSSIFGHLVPFLVGFGIAFVLNGPVMWVESKLHSLKITNGKKRVLSAAVVFLCFLLLMVLVIWVVIPNLVNSIRGFAGNIATYASRFEDILRQIAGDFDLDFEKVETALTSLNLPDRLTSTLQASITKMMSYSANIIHFLTNMIIALAAAFYMIMDKESLMRTFKRLFYAIFGKNNGNIMVIFVKDAKNVFEQYIVGNLIDSTVVGIICWIGCLILSLPYAPMVGMIVGITNIIPVFGPFLGAIPVILLYVLIQPSYALIFAVFILILQQVDGNVFKPMILGDKLGISGFWILFSVTLGGSLFGITGMFLGVPVFALIYQTVSDLTDYILKKRHIVVPENGGIIE